MSYWFCPACHDRLYWRLVRPPGDYDKCPYCRTTLRVHWPRVLWLLAWTGAVAQAIVFSMDRQLLSVLAERYFTLHLTPETISLAGLALQSPALVLGPRFDVLHQRNP